MGDCGGCGGLSTSHVSISRLRMVESHVKRKNPPTFRHLPINRAKKLKRTWVENVKIKSQWKAQKRKELQPSTSAQGHEQDDDGESDAEESHIEQEENLVQDGVIPSSRKSAIYPSRAHKIPGQAPPSKGREDDTDKDHLSEPTSSLRDLTQKAYSRSSLHTFKSDPLNPGRGSRGGRGDERRGTERGQGCRGQPNMKLRMGAVLEKIKRDFA